MCERYFTLSVRNKLLLGYAYWGDRTAKNILQPIKVYRVLMDRDYAGKIIGEKGPKRTRRRLAAALAVVLMVGR